MIFAWLEMKSSFHENFNRDDAAVPGSDRNFGLVMAGALSLLSLLNGWHHGRLWPWMGSAAVAFAASALTRSQALRPLNLAWIKLGLLLHKIMNPIVMGVLFFGAIWPTGFVMRMRGADLLRLEREPELNSYWIARSPGPSPETMRDQF